MLGTDFGNDLGNLGTVSRHMRTYGNRKTAIRNGETRSLEQQHQFKKEGKKGEPRAAR